ncbi:MAG: prenyltransferase/squalene oxidase repeat-containing protein [Candidatus Bathyarchaeia archaeon]
MKKTYSLIAILILSLLSSSIYLTNPAQAYPYNKTDEIIQLSLNWLRNQQNLDGSIGSFAVSSWVVMAIASSERDPNAWIKNGASIVQYLKNNVNQLNPSSCTDYSRFILSMVAAGEDPKNINNIDLIAKLESFYDGTQFGDQGLLNDDFWAVMALISAGIDKNDPKIQNAVNFIKAHQNNDGGWSFDTAASYGSDVDSTAAAIMALIAAGESSSSQSIINALNYIKSKQDETGGFNSGWGYSAETDSWAIQAIVAAGQDPTSDYWTINGNNPVTHLLTFRNQDGSFKDWSNSPSIWTTAYAIPALLGKPYPVIKGVRVNIRIEGQYSTIWNGEVFVSCSNITDKIGAFHYYAKPTVLGALDAASKKAGFSYIVDYSWGSAYVTTINGEAASGMKGWLFRVNYYTTGSYSADQFILNEVSSPSPPHTYILWYYGEWGYKVTKISIDKTVVQKGESFTVSIRYLDDNSGNWLPLEGATVYANETTYLTNSTGQASIKLYIEGNYIIYASKQDFVRSEKIVVIVCPGTGENSSNLRVNLIPALSIEVSPSLIDFGTLGPGDTSQIFILTLRNEGSLNAKLSATVIDYESTIFQDCLQLAEGAQGPWTHWSSYGKKDIEGHGGTKTIYVRLQIPSNYPTPIVGVNTGKITFWLEAPP